MSVSAIAAAGAVLAAIWTIIQAGKTAKRLETFQHLRDVNRALNALGAVDIEDVHRELVTYYEGSEDDLSTAGQRFKEFLDTLELLAFAIEMKAVTGDIAHGYLRLITQGHMLPFPFRLSVRGRSVISPLPCSPALLRQNDCGAHTAEVPCDWRREIPLAVRPYPGVRDLR